MSNQIQLQMEHKDGKVRPIRRMDRVEWMFTIAACVVFEIIPVMLTIDAWTYYGMLAGLATALLPVAVLLWMIKQIWNRETKGE